MYSCAARLYELPSGKGRVVSTIDMAIKDLGEFDFDDKVSSVKITGPCRWIFYSDSNFNGEASILDPGAHASLGSKDNTFSSLRPLPPQGTTAAVVFEGAKFCGSMMVLTKAYNRLANMGFNDKPMSIIITGGTWAFCQHGWKGFEGYTDKLGPGDYPEVSKKLEHKISLVKLVKK